MRAVICWAGARGVSGFRELECMMSVGVGCVVTVSCFLLLRWSGRLSVLLFGCAIGGSEIDCVE